MRNGKRLGPLSLPVIFLAVVSCSTLDVSMLDVSTLEVRLIDALQSVLQTGIDTEQAGPGNGVEPSPTLLQSGTKDGESSSGDPSLADYLRMNDEEQRLGDYKDSEQMLRLKLDQLAYINRSRRRHGAPPVELDILASRVANAMAREACVESFQGHWNTRGEKPYHRYAFAGGLDHVSENASAAWSSAAIPRTPESYAGQMRGAHDRFMAETPPNDGHKRNCIAREHNYVGLGVWIEGTQFRYYEEYIDRYLDFLEAPTQMESGEQALIVVRAMDPSFYIYALSAYYEPIPAPMTPQQINRKGSYPDYTEVRALSLWPWELEKHRQGDVFHIPVSFEKKGLYYVQLYLSDQPYSTTSASTRGKTQASGLVIRVR